MKYKKQTMFIIKTLYSIFIFNRSIYRLKVISVTLTSHHITLPNPYPNLTVTVFNKAKP